MKVGENAVIDAVHVKGELRRRLVSLGLVRNANISVRHFGWFKSTVQVMINRSSIALRKEEAQMISVHKI
jgi:ferrous iron transport protein A